MKDSNFNIAFCELSGYVPVGSDEIYDKLSEEFILDKIQANIGNVYKKFDEIISQLF